MQRFKFVHPKTHSHSFHQNNKTQNIIFITMLDKCTQILREDRVWLRREIKCGCTEVLNIFRAQRKASQLQHLQIKLRRYVQDMKNKLKKDQLNRFREALNPNVSSNLPDFFKKSNKMLSKSKRDHSLGQKYNNNIDRYHLLKINDNRQILKTSTSKQVKCKQLQQDSKKRTKLCTSLKNFNQTFKHKYNPYIIEEHESENVTSARLRRQESEQQIKMLPLQESYFQKASNRVKANIENLEHKYSHIMKSLQPERENMKKQQISKASQPKNIKLDTVEWNFEQHKLKDNKNNIKKNIPESSNKKSQNKEQEDSIFDRYFGEMSKQSIYSKSNYHLNDLQVTNQNQSIKWSDQYKPYQGKNEDVSNSKRLELDQERFKPIFTEKMLKIKDMPIIDELPIAKTDESIYTSIQLLNECRNFLKKRDSSHFKQLSAAKNKQQSPKFNQTCFETFANKDLSKLLKNRLDENSSASIKKEVHQLDYNQLKIERFVQQMLVLNEMSPFINVSQLAKYCNKNANNIYKAVLSNVYSNEPQQQVCLADLACLLSNFYYENTKKCYQLADNISVKNIYDLLDIQQKGYICRNDIESFLEQIKHAEVQNYDEVAQSLWRAFEYADFKREDKISYWNFYLIKDTAQFEKAIGLLSEFQFQIQREDI